ERLVDLDGGTGFGTAAEHAGGHSGDARLPCRIGDSACTGGDAHQDLGQIGFFDDEDLHAVVELGCFDLGGREGTLGAESGLDRAVNGNFRGSAGLFGAEADEYALVSVEILVYGTPKAFAGVGPVAGDVFVE